MKNLGCLLAGVVALFVLSACDPELDDPVIPQPELLACADMSDNWEIVRTESDLVDLSTDIFYLDENTAIAIKETDIRRTTDGGTTWSIISRYFLPDGGVDTTALTSAFFRNISQDDEGVLYISGTLEDQGSMRVDPEMVDGVVLYSTDMGLTWGKRYLSENLVWVDTGTFFGNGRGFLAGRGRPSSQTGENAKHFFETSDGGETWTPMLPGFDTYQFREDFKTSPQGNIYWIDRDGSEFTLVIFDRINREWKTQSVPGNNLFYMTENVVFCQDIDKKIHKSTDGGLTWEEYEEIVLGEHDNIRYYSDGEDNWMMMVARLRPLTDPGNVLSEPRLTVAQFDVNETTDGGETWTIRSVGPGCLYNADFRYFENIGYVKVCCSGKQVIRFNP